MEDVLPGHPQVDEPGKDRRKPCTSKSDDAVLAASRSPSTSTASPSGLATPGTSRAPALRVTSDQRVDRVAGPQDSGLGLVQNEREPLSVEARKEGCS